MNASIHASTTRRGDITDAEAWSLYGYGGAVLTTAPDLLRFMRDYRARPLREILRSEGRFWSAVQRRAERLRRSAPGMLP